MRGVSKARSTLVGNPGTHVPRILLLALILKLSSKSNFRIHPGTHTQCCFSSRGHGMRWSIVMRMVFPLIIYFRFGRECNRKNEATCGLFFLGRVPKETENWFRPSGPTAHRSCRFRPRCHPDQRGKAARPACPAPDSLQSASHAPAKCCALFRCLAQ